MTGAEHYAEAERLLLAARLSDIKRLEGLSVDEDEARGIAARAQIHATLAAAAGAALPTVAQYMGDADEVTAWGRAIGWQREEIVDAEAGEHS